MRRLRTAEEKLRTRARVLDLRKEGLTFAEIGERLGLTKWAANQYALWDGQGPVYRHYGSDALANGHRDARKSLRPGDFAWLEILKRTPGLTEAELEAAQLPKRIIKAWKQEAA